MAGSQLKRLKASLKDQGIIGPQKSKKERSKNAQQQKDKRINRGEALAGIREQFNPFQFKTNARGPKFDVTTNKPATAHAALGIAGRPGVAKSVGEERRRQTLLVEMQRRNKVGGIVDRRFGESDPTMSLEDKMMERFAREQQRSHKKGAVFDLEDDDDEPIEGLTHGGKALTFDDVTLKDDFEEDDLGGSADESEDDGMHPDRKRLKRMRLTEDGDEDAAAGDQPDRKKTKKEIYEEIIAKSKFHKYERQAAKEEDDDLRMELDQALPELQALLFQRQKPEAKGEQPGLKIAGVDKAVVDKDYDIRVKQLAADKRAAPTEKTKTEEQRAEEESKRLKELEEKRLRRMRGEMVSDDEEEEEPKKRKSAVEEADFETRDEAETDEFGLGTGIRLRPTATELGFDDEDDFEIDDDLVASGSDLEFDEDDDMDEYEEDTDAEEESDPEDDEFTKGLLTETESKNRVFQPVQSSGDDKDGVPYTFECPETHEHMVEVFQGIEVTKLPVAVQRIRALYHPKLASGNKEKLGNFSQALVQHIAYLGDRFEPHWFPTLEALTRHVHSLAKSVPIEVSKGYRTHIEEMERERPLDLTVGDLLVLTAISTTFPTSDHFHQVVTPAMLAIARYLGQKRPKELADYATGTYLSILAIQYQQFSKRYVPELMNFCLNTLSSLAHEKPREKLGFFPLHEPTTGIRISNGSKTTVRKLNCSDCQPSTSTLSPEASNSLKVAIIATTAAVLKTAAETWHALPSFYETFQPAQRVLQHLATAPSNKTHLPAALLAKLSDTLTNLSRLLQLAHVSRRPLELHHHKPLAIKSVVPKFEDSFDPTKHYDPDRERAELAKLKKEHKRERKGAMRELRKDAAFMARENLRVKKEKDAAYDKKYKRLVAEIQGEEGQAANAYEREKAARKKKANKW